MYFDGEEALVTYDRQYPLAEKKMMGKMVKRDGGDVSEQEDVEMPDVKTDPKLTLMKRLSDIGMEEAAKRSTKRTTLLLPQRKADQGKLTVILDMDETLIHSEFTGKSTIDYRQAEERLKVSGRRAPDFTIKLYENTPEQEIVHVYKRPGLDNFLKRLSEICEPVIFTASLPMYARPILKEIDPKRRCKSRLYRNATVKFLGYPHVKSLQHLGRDTRRCILVDNSPFAMCADPDNAIPIKSYYDEEDDRELEYLFEIIREMVTMEDVRPHLRRKFNFADTLQVILGASPPPPSE